MGRPSNREERRKQIVLALGRLIPTQGFRGTSIKDIAKEAELGSGLVHYHFKSKMEIFLSLIAHLNGVVQNRFEARESTDPEENLKAFIDAHLALGDDADEAAVACWVAIGAESLSDPEVAAAYHEVMSRRAEQLSEIVVALCKQRNVPARRASSFVATITALIEGTFHVAATVPHLIPKGSAAETVFLTASSIICVE